MSKSSAALISIFFALCLSSISTVIQGEDFPQVHLYFDSHNTANRNNLGQMRTDLGNGNAVGVNVTSKARNSHIQTNTQQAPVPVGQISTIGTSLASRGPTISIAELRLKLRELKSDLVYASKLPQHLFLNNQHDIAKILIDYLTLYHRTEPNVNLMDVASVLINQNNIPYIRGFEGKVQTIQLEAIHKENEAIRIKQQLESMPRLRVGDVQEMALLVTHCTQAAQKRGAHERFTARTAAIEQTRRQHGQCFDYASQVSCLDSNDKYTVIFSQTYGTPLDCQLHKELCQTRSMMMQLERDFSGSYHVQIFAPMIHRLAAQAKTEQAPSAAFLLSDFCYDVVQIVTKGVHALYGFSHAAAKGSLNGVKEYLSPEHWRQMATGALNLGLIFLDLTGEEVAFETYQNKVFGAALSGNSEAIPQLAQEYCAYSKPQWDAIDQNIKKTYRKIKVMPWPKLVEHGAECGTMLMLDLLTFGAMNRFAGVGGRVVFAELSEAMESGFLFTQQHAVEVAGFGKVIIEEGAEVAPRIGNILKNDPALFSQGGESIAQKAKRNLPTFRWADGLVHKIRNIGDDILDIMEKAGGHALERHVSKTNNGLVSRVKGAARTKNKIESASSFTDKRTAIDAVKESLKYHAEEIAAWLESNPALNDQIVIEFSHLYSIGKTVPQKNSQIIYDLTKSRMVLRPDPTLDFGFKIITAFPILK